MTVLDATHTLGNVRRTENNFSTEDADMFRFLSFAAPIARRQTRSTAYRRPMNGIHSICTVRSFVYSPRLEILEDRLPPGDALGGIMWGWSLTCSDTQDEFLLSDSIVKTADPLLTLDMLPNAIAEDKEALTQEKAAVFSRLQSPLDEDPFQHSQLEVDPLPDPFRSRSGSRVGGTFQRMETVIRRDTVEVPGMLTAVVASVRHSTSTMVPPSVNVSSAAVEIGDTAVSPDGNGKTAPPTVYAADFVSTAATGAAMNDSGDVTGTSYPDTGCGPFCLPPLETVVWRGSERIVLPDVPGLPGITVRSINNHGWVAGFAGFPGTTTHAVVWKPNGSTYQAIDVGTLPGTSISDATGIDNLGRVVGWSTTSNFPPNGSPFMWTESTGMVDLSTQGFPDEVPIALSPGGAVATPGFWYKLEDPSSVIAMPSPPTGFYLPGTYQTAINDAGDQARFLVSTSSQNLRYLFRFHHEGTWQQISFTGQGNLSKYGVGSINLAGDVTATVLGNGVIAHGPDGTTQPLIGLLSPAYQAGSITLGGPINSEGQILSQFIIGQSQRLVRLTPTEGCTTGCIQVSSLVVKAKFIEDPNDPDHCTQDGNAYNEASVNLTITSETGTKLRGVVVSGRFLDDYWTNAPVAGRTNRRGVVSFSQTGPCGVGAIAFLVDNAIKGPLAFDRTVGILTGWEIPH